MQTLESTELAPERPRYPLTLAVAWIAAFGLVDWAAYGTWRSEPAYLPVVAAVAWYYGWRTGLLVALLATLSVFIVDLVVTPGLGALALAWNVVASACTYVVPAWLAAELGRSHRRLAMVMTTDSDSGLLNRSGLLARLEDELLRTERFGGDLSILCVGVDGLSGFADDKRPDQVQRLLFRFSEVLRVFTRRTDTVARIGEDEFAVLMPGTGSETAQQVAERHQRAFDEWLQAQGERLSCSIGHTTSPLGRKLGAPALLACAVADMQERRPAPPRPAPPPAASDTSASRPLVAG